MGPNPLWRPYERLGHRHARRNDHKEKVATYKPRKEASEATDPADTLILDVLAFRIGRK